jgi:hypothetical protein
VEEELRGAYICIVPGQREYFVVFVLQVLCRGERKFEVTNNLSMWRQWGASLVSGLSGLFALAAAREVAWNFDNS